jgi:hypothetical protein
MRFLSLIAVAHFLVAHVGSTSQASDLQFPGSRMAGFWRWEMPAALSKFYQTLLFCCGKHMITRRPSHAFAGIPPVN